MEQTKTVKKFGQRGAHVIVPSYLVGQEVTIVYPNKKEEEE